VTRAKPDEPYRLALQQQITAAARELLSGSVSITEAARRIIGPAYELGSALEEPFATFLSIDSETDAFPLGSVRERWSPSALQRQDAERERYEAAIRDRALDACREILRRLDTEG
jgi:Protein of unknown function (DUF2489)